MPRLKMNSEIKRKALTISLPPELFDKLHKLAYDKVMSVSALVERYLRTEISNEENPYIEPEWLKTDTNEQK